MKEVLSIEFHFDSVNIETMKPLLIFFSILFSVSPSWASKVISIKNDRVLLNLEGEALGPGDKLLARDSRGKSKGLLEIKQVKDGKAVAALLKGQVQKEFGLVKVTSAATSQSPSEKSYWGLMGGQTATTMTIKPSGSASVSLSGSSTSVSGFYQMSVDGGFSTRLLLGLETLKAEGASSSVASCNGATNCQIDISYLGLETLIRYSVLRKSSLDFWMGAGLGFLFALNKSSNILDTGKITTNQTIVGSLGLDWKLSKDQFVPFQVDYAVFPDNSTSSAHQLIVRLGYGHSF